MKKLLLATTAAAALTFGASAARAEIDLDLGGFFKGYAGYASNDDTGAADARKFDIKRKSQVFFTGETTLDNGLTVGYHGELSQDNDAAYASSTASGDTALEESYLYMSGNWGRLNLGRENGAAYLLQVAAPSADANLDGQDIAFNFANIIASDTATAAGQFNGGAGVDFDYQQSGPTLDAQYSDKITYLTPKFNGFQAGVSYTPEYESYVRGTQQAVNFSNDGGLENLMEAAVRYDGEFSGVGLHVGGGYTTAAQEIDAAGTDDYNEWNAGLKLTFEGFGFGGAYNTDNQGLSDADTDSWTVGADYTYGAYTFGASYFTSEADATTVGGTDELDRYTVGASYTYGPGMAFRGAVAYFDYDAATAAFDNTATVVTVGTDVQF